MIVPPRARLPLLALGIVALLAAIWGGLMRLGWDLPSLRPRLSAAHGPLMVSAFLGAVIGLERAVALKRPWGYLAALLPGLAGIVLIFYPTASAGRILAAAGSLVLVALFVLIIRMQPALYTFAMGLGAVAWLVGNLVWLVDRPLHEAALWWGGFLVLTIAGERLELGRLLRFPRRVRGAFVLAGLVFIAGLVIGLADFGLGMRVFGVGMLALSVWLLSHDMARRTIRQPGLPRFIAVALLLGYVWLAASGVLALAFGGVTAGPRYDAALHALFLGFVFSMIFGHAPIIFPAVLRRAMPFQERFYAHLALLHVSLGLRVIGDLAGWQAGREWGGLLNGVAILLFLVNTVASALQTQVPQRAR